MSIISEGKEERNSAIADWKFGMVGGTGSRASLAIGCFDEAVTPIIYVCASSQPETTNLYVLHPQLHQ